VSIEEAAPNTHPTANPPAAFAAFSGASRAEKYLELNATQASAPSNSAEEDLPSTTSGPATTVERPRTDVTELRTARFFHTPNPDSEKSKHDRATAQHGLRGLLSRLGLHIAPSRSEAESSTAADRASADEVTIRQATWTRAVSILVANPKGGVGKTPTAILLGGTLATIRGGSVCIMEVSDDPGALTYRAEGTPTLGMGELVRDITTIRSAGQLAGYTAPQTSYASILGTVGTRPQLTGDDVAAVTTVIDDYYAVRVMDSGNQPSSSAFHSAVDRADILVIPMFDAGDAALEAIALLDTLRSEGGRAAHLADRAVLLRLTDGRPENPRITARVDEIITASGITEVFPIPYDAHIAERDQLTLAKLALPTRVALIAAAAAIVRSLQTTVR
jgi:MinD-like ATPase involved in chromosome partitioning or flagellar assembly